VLAEVAWSCRHPVQATVLQSDDVGSIKHDLAECRAPYGRWLSMGVEAARFLWPRCHKQVPRLCGDNRDVAAINCLWFILFGREDISIPKIRQGPSR